MVFNIMLRAVFPHLSTGVMIRAGGVEGVSHGISGGAPSGGGLTCGTIQSLLTPSVLFLLPDAFIMGCERQIDKVDSLEVACHGFRRSF